ncbi:hypothetical protein H9Q13_03995 [Pontibacter sp. JH31]|uniref:Oxygen tolerance n=1 Tax=Pontibacter aquaedesilientis TaxID=2766980 RepID=A0ABR7XEI2_9BACT|nr:hypothetical protein [Pontibacter aquaedesilientis]MBD1396316.1 hypothetical protein [Pontibacter aquaedesilientis]
MRKVFLLILLYLFTLSTWAQQVMPPVGRFSSDTIRIGELLRYTLVHRHPATQEVILPDSSFDFSPFELVRQSFYPTRTKAGISTDSAVYTLRTFETMPLQRLVLPVIALHGQDTLQVFAPPQQVILQQMVPYVQDPLSLKTQTELIPIPERFDWPIILLWVLTAIFVLALIWLVFGQAIKTKYQLYRLRKDHLYFNSRYNSHVDRFVKSGSASSMEKAVALWKNYLTKLERSAINSFTTKEIVEFYDDDEQVNLALRFCDKAIYGNVVAEPDTETNQALGMLRRFARGRYKTQRELTRNAKNQR